MTADPNDDVLPDLERTLGALDGVLQRLVVEFSDSFTTAEICGAVRASAREVATEPAADREARVEQHARERLRQAFDEA
ncbi:hypothetical protein [Solicola sp. PLA-1-18]|uniref:hypothetical protein n=1 Tax=Solicola sp. PLA-1-18 TaxID=3380532 RepID=UPI003B77B844